MTPVITIPLWITIPYSVIAVVALIYYIRLNRHRIQFYLVEVFLESLFFGIVWPAMFLIMGWYRFTDWLAARTGK